MADNDWFDTEVVTERQVGDNFAFQNLPLPTETDLGTFVRKDVVVAKGDLIAGTAGASVARQALGTNDQVLTVDTSTTTGLKYATPTVAAPTTAQFVTLATDAGLANERVLTGTTNQIALADGGAGGNIVLSTPQNIHTGATPTFAGVILSAAGRLALKVTTPTQIAANTNDYNPGTGSFFRITTDASRNITGIVAGADGDLLYFRNAGSFDFVLTNLDAASTAANQIITGTGASVTYPPNDIAALVYDITSARWVVIL